MPGFTLLVMAHAGSSHRRYPYFFFFFQQPGKRIHQRLPFRTLQIHTPSSDVKGFHCPRLLPFRPQGTRAFRCWPGTTHQRWPGSRSSFYTPLPPSRCLPPFIPLYSEWITLLSQHYSSVSYSIPPEPAGVPKGLICCSQAVSVVLQHKYFERPLGRWESEGCFPHLVSRGQYMHYAWSLWISREGHRGLFRQSRRAGGV